MNAVTEYINIRRELIKEFKKYVVPEDQRILSWVDDILDDVSKLIETVEMERVFIPEEDFK